MQCFEDTLGKPSRAGEVVGVPSMANVTSKHSKLSQSERLEIATWFLDAKLGRFRRMSSIAFIIYGRPSLARIIQPLNW